MLYIRHLLICNRFIVIMIILVYTLCKFNYGIVYNLTEVFRAIYILKKVNDSYIFFQLALNARNRPTIS
uniref:Uncharacterized protein n=1 Tax=viral metagenome TaxID=1070528 RepID=A0A6C0BAT6_9ZZZZ